MQGLTTLPYEVLANIVSHVHFDDIICLGRTCTFFQYLHTEESICKCLVQVRFQYHQVMCSRKHADTIIQPLTQDADKYFILQ